jgi:spore coat polysaccharide biosynthesis predicted glycosyltransferase SpsG
MNNITILTEAGKTIGFGHYTRCSSLYQAFIKAGNQVRFIIYENEYAINDPNIQSLNWLKSIDSLYPIATTDIAIIDSYLADENTYTQLAERFHKVVAIDDYNRISYPIDLVINPNVFFEDIDYSNQTAVCLGGKDYVILRPEFIQVEPSFSDNETLQNILITIGGSDFRNLLPKLISICEQQKGVNITVIDPENKLSNLKHIKVLPAQTATQMVHEMQRADVVISACGQTLHELVTLQKPTIGICLDIDQIPNQNFYTKHGFLSAAIQWNDENIANEIAEQLTGYSLSANRKRIRKVCKSLISKNGAQQIATYINTIQ